MAEGIDAEVNPNSELNNGEPVKTVCDPLILPRYRVNPQGEDDMSEKCNQRKVGDFKEHRLSATEGNVGFGEWTSHNWLTAPAYNLATTTLQELSGRARG